MCELLVMYDLCKLNFRTGDSRGFAFVRYKYADEAQKAVERLDGEFCCLFCFGDYM